MADVGLLQHGFGGPKGITEASKHSTLNARVSDEFQTGFDSLSSPFDCLFAAKITQAKIHSLSIVEKQNWLMAVHLSKIHFAQQKDQPSWASRDQYLITPAYFQP